MAITLKTINALIKLSEEKLMSEISLTYESIRQVMIANYQIAQASGKKIIFLVGEDHKLLGCSLLEALILDIASNLCEIDSLLYEKGLLKRNIFKIAGKSHVEVYHDLSFVNRLGFRHRMIDTFNTEENRKNLPPLEFFNKRNQEMHRNISAHSESAVCFIGAGHFVGLLDEYPLDNSIFHVCPLNTATRPKTAMELGCNSTSVWKSAHLGWKSSTETSTLLSKELEECDKWDDLFRIDLLNTEFEHDNVLKALTDAELLTKFSEKRYLRLQAELAYEEDHCLRATKIDRHPKIIRLRYPSEFTVKCLNGATLHHKVSLISCHHAEKRLPSEKMGTKRPH